MKRCLLAAAAAHLLLLVALYLSHVLRADTDLQARQRADRLRHEQLYEQALAERRLERRARNQAADAGAALPGLAADGRLSPGRGPRGGSPHSLLPGAAHRGPSVARQLDENAVLTELSSVRPVPARELVGTPAQVTWVFLDSWYTLGPLPLEGSLQTAPRAVDLDARPTGMSGDPLRWRFLQRTRPDFTPETMTPYSLHYAFTRVRSDRERDVWFAFGADDSMQVWLDGELIWDCAEHWRGWVVDEGARRVTLPAGESQLLVRLRNWPQIGTFSVLLRIAP